VGDRAGEGKAYGSLGNAHDSMGDFAQAIAYHTQHLAIAREVGDRVGEGNAGNNLGVALEKNINLPAAARPRAGPRRVSARGARLGRARRPPRVAV